MPIDSKRVFISGGNGVIGRAMVNALINQGAVLFVGDLKPQPKEWHGKLHYRQGDLNSIQSWEVDAFQPEYFIHLAATFERADETFEFWEENIHHNAKLSSHLMSVMKSQKSLERVIFASSYLIYDKNTYCFDTPRQQPVSLDETHSILPRNLCGSAKLNHEIELDFLSSSPNTEFTAVCARIYRSYGLHSRDIISRWIRMALNDETLTLHGEEGIFDYIYAGDVAEGLLRLADSPVTGIINLGRGKSRRVSDIIEILKSHFPNLSVKTEPAVTPYEASQADMGKMRRLLNWSPSKDLEETIPVMIQHEKDHPYGQDQADLFSLLVTSASQKISCLQAVKDALDRTFSSYDRDRHASKLYAADTNSECLAKYFSDGFWEMPLLSDLTVKDLISYCDSHNIKAIIPTRDGELEYFAEHKQELSESGIRILISDLTAVRTCLDKVCFYRILKEKGYPAIETVRDASLISPTSYVVKEQFGAGSKTILLSATRNDAQRHAKTLDNPVFQPFIAGTEYSVDVYITLAHKAKGAVVRERTLVIDGESKVTTTLHDQDMTDLCMNASIALGLYGHSVWQLLKTSDNNLHIIECNCRFGGASSAALAVGLDSFYWFLQEVIHGTSDHIDFIRHPGDIQQIRYPANDISL